MWPTEYDTRLDEFDSMPLPGQQLAAAQASTPLDHILNLDVNLPPACLRLTVIAATVGRLANDIETLEQLMSAGMNIAILNMSFGTREEHIDIVKQLRIAVKSFSTKMGRHFPLAIAFRLCGRKIRTGRIAETYGDDVELKAGEMIRLTSDETYRERCSMYTVYVDFVNFANQLKKNNVVLLDNETIMLRVDVVSTTTLTCKIERGGILGSYKDVFVPNVVFDMPNYSEKDKSDVDFAIHHQVDFLIAAFVNNKHTVNELRHMLGERGKKIGIIANVQTTEGYRNFTDILSVTNGIMITRQELGSDISPEKLVIAQKNMIARANKENVPIMISTHLLSSMRHNKIALRSELLDVANCVIDGCDGLALTAETAVGTYPVESVASVSSACKEAEACIWSRQLFIDLIDKTEMPCDQSAGTAIAAVLASHKLIAAAIIVITSTGKSAHLVAKYRPRCPIIAVTRFGPIARQLHMWRGILPLHYDANVDPDWQVDIENRVSFCTKWGLDRGFIRIGDPVVIVSGWRQGSGYTNTMRVIYVSKDSFISR